MSVLVCDDLTLGYEGHTALSNVSFTVEDGDYLYIVGENGSGKSTLMKGILGLIKPQSGKITYTGIKQTDIGYLPQQTVVQKDFPANVFEVVLSGCLNRNGFSLFFSKQDRQLAEDTIAMLGIENLKKKSYRELSGGQQQRVLLARALCATEKILLLDEPVTGLDPIMTAEMYELIKKLNQEKKITVIMISHDIKSAVTYGNKILHLQNKLLFFGSVEDYVKTPVGIRMMGGAEQ